uniref:F-box domain-containing protein n=1 Tax=Zea mays TaxID=4577 RepID=A0A804NZ75_MAIZE
MGVGAMEASSPACDDAGTTIEDLPADVLALVLRRLDGASLAAVGCASSGLHALATDPATWRALCLAIPQPLPARLVSAVDLRHAGGCVLSCVVDTDAASDWFLGAPFRVAGACVLSCVVDTDAASDWFLGAPFRVDVDAPLHEGFASSPAAVAPVDLELSWVLVDPATGRALGAASRRAVSVDRKWLTWDTVARFAVVIGGGVALEAAVTCDVGQYGHVREVSLRVEDADGAGVSGRDGLAAVAAAMAAPRRGCRGAAEDAARARYEDFVRGRRARKEWKARRESILDLCCSGVGAAAFLGFLLMLTFR